MKKEKALSSSDISYLEKFTTEPSKNWFKNIYIYITDKCQLQCKHCYLGSRLRKGTVMPKKDVFDNLLFWKKLGGEKLCFLGGEPTLHPQFEEIVKYANKLKYRIITIDTNGLAISLVKLSALKPSDFSYIQISLDGGSANTNDNIRGKGAFKETLKTIEALCKRGFDIRIICTVNKENLRDCLNILPLADSLRVSLVKYHIFSEIGIGKKNSDLLLSPYEWNNFIKKLIKLKGKYKTKIQYQAAYGKKETEEAYFKQGYRGCVGRRLDRMSIFSDDRVYICSYLFDMDLNFAKIDLNNKKLRIRKDKSNELNLFSNKLKKCDKCNFYKICAGGCSAENLIKKQSPCNKYKNIYSVCRLWKADV